MDDNLADIQLRIPNVDDHFTVFPIAAALQLIAYYASVSKHLDVDQPRNLAKSVTVEWALLTDREKIWGSSDREQSIRQTG